MAAPTALTPARQRGIISLAAARMDVRLKKTVGSIPTLRQYGLGSSET